MWQVLADLPMVWAAVILVGALVRASPIDRPRHGAVRDRRRHRLAAARRGRSAAGGRRVLRGARRRTRRHRTSRPLGSPCRGRRSSRRRHTSSARPAASGHWVLLLGSFATIVAAPPAPCSACSPGSCARRRPPRPSTSRSARAPGDRASTTCGSRSARLGVVTTDLGVADRQAAGQFAVAATGTDGDELIVKVYGRDAYDAALLSTVQRTIWLRRRGSPVGFGRLRQVEHEAFLTLLAGQAGVPTDRWSSPDRRRATTPCSCSDGPARWLVPAKRVVTSETATVERFSGPDALERIRELWELVERLHEQRDRPRPDRRGPSDHRSRRPTRPRSTSAGRAWRRPRPSCAATRCRRSSRRVILAGRDLAIAALVVEPFERAHRSAACRTCSRSRSRRSATDDQRPRHRPRRRPFGGGRGDQPRGADDWCSSAGSASVRSSASRCRCWRCSCSCRRSPVSTSTSSSNRCRTPTGGSCCSA